MAVYRERSRSFCPPTSHSLPWHQPSGSNGAGSVWLAPICTGLASSGVSSMRGRAIAPLRNGGPSRLPAARGVAPDLSSPWKQNMAWLQFTAGVYAASSQSSHVSRWSRAMQMLSDWQLSPLPVTAEKMLKLGASLKQGGFLSAVRGASPTQLQYIGPTRMRKGRVSAALVSRRNPRAYRCNGLGNFQTPASRWSMGVPCGRGQL